MKFVKADVQLRLRIMGNCMGTFSPRAPATASSSQILSWIDGLEILVYAPTLDLWLSPCIHCISGTNEVWHPLEHCHFETQINQYLVSVRQFLKIKCLITLPLLTTLHSVNLLDTP